MAATTSPEAVRRLVSPARLDDLHVDDGGLVSSLPERDPPRSRRFEGLYGRAYNRVIQAPALRRAAFSVWGSADPLYDLDRFVEDAVEAAHAIGGGSPVLVDLPSGGGTLLPFLHRYGFAGTAVEVDLATAMLRRALTLADDIGAGFETVFLRSDALDLPLRADLADVVVSVNGLHVVADHARLLSEVARIAKPGGGLWLITPVRGPSARSRAILAAARALGVTPRPPPTLPELRRLIADVGLREVRSYGGESITGLACRTAAD
ncbi:MAG: class I SAM-dependent methyltransferase [Actinomycetota bacterium]|nr:class I SAM-dependent methyltransferase [Actinomycetota bacterium]